MKKCSELGRVISHVHLLTCFLTSVIPNPFNWASVSEPHTCDFNATFSLYIIMLYVIYLSICDRHCTSKIAINISIFHLGSYTRRARIVPRRGAVGPTHFQSHCPRGPSCELTCSLCSSGIVHVAVRWLEHHSRAIVGGSS